MSNWRDFLVTSDPQKEMPSKPPKGDFADIADIALKDEKKESSSLYSSLQNSIYQGTFAKSAKLPTQEADRRCAVDSEALVPPIRTGWLVAYRHAQGGLVGGCDDRENGTVRQCEWGGKFWTVVLTNGQRLPLRLILSVAKMDAEGRMLAAWTVRAHGYDGESGRR
jgi:hypothetical protein